MVTKEWGEFFYAPPANVLDSRIVLDAAEAHHLFRVRRVEAGETVRATTGAGMVFTCTVAPDHSLEIIERHENFGEPSVHVTLGMAVLKGDLNRDVVDLATQLGVRSILFFQAERTERKLAAEKLEKLQRTAIAAIKQCGRAWLPEIQIVTDLRTVLKRIPADTTVYLAHPANEALTNAAPFAPKQGAALLVGPEGGFSSLEVQIAMSNGAVPLHLGDRRLRAETAVVAGLSWVLARAGEMGIRLET